MFMCRK